MAQDFPAPCPRCSARPPAEARFCPSCGTALQPPGAAEPPPPAEGPGELATELRPLTALFADVVGSTSLGERLRPDEVKALIGECVSRMSHAVEEFGGTIQAYMGDGIAAYFGLPAAHEDDPERAAHAALRILEVVEEYARDIDRAWGITDFNVRVGINSGQVAAGIVGAGKPQAVGLGDATNVAARLQGATAPGTIAAGEQTAKLLAHRFVLEPIGEVQLKGREAAVSAWRLVGPRTDRDEPTTPLVGREAEMGRLAAALEDLKAGRGQVVTLVGEVGLGKARLLWELRHLAGDDVLWLEGRCLSYGGALPYWPFVEMLREWLGVGEGDAEVGIRTRLRARMGAWLGDRLPEALPYLGQLLSLRPEPEFEAHLRSLTPEEFGRRVRAAFGVWIESLAATRPVVVALQDLHWADASTRQLAEDLLDVTDRAPVTIVATFRPDPQSEAWAFRLRATAGHPHRLVELHLGPLSREAAEALAERLVAAGELDGWTKDAVVDRAEGNPLYLEELLHGLIESGVLERRRTWTLSLSQQDLLPPALESLLVARIDRLPAPARALAQVAAVVGRTFLKRLLERVTAADIDDEIATLLRADMIREHRRYPELEYTFRHGLLQEAALATLPEGTRRDLHRRVAEAVAEVFPDSLEDHVEVLAHHYTEARDLPRALEYLDRAGSKAMASGSPDEAREMWLRALKVARRAGDAGAEARLAPKVAEPPAG
ncbi:MAG TPA: adenylate/guanylate cyclase domain-containing protein [Actinomycetota bacterium]|nr:adenylate/guanylate cyclase domain-containing protein [Actinomycetota bacterium]